MKFTDKREQYFQRILAKLQQDPLFELRQELGLLLMRHIDTFSEAEMQRYNELKELLKVKEQ